MSCKRLVTNGGQIMRNMKYLINRRAPCDLRLDISRIRTSAANYWNSADDFLHNLYDGWNEPIAVKISVRYMRSQRFI